MPLPKSGSSTSYPPLSFDITASRIVDEAEGIIESTHSVREDVIARIKPEEATFTNTVQPFAEDENFRSHRESYLRFFASTSSSKHLRDASTTATRLFSEARIDFFSDGRLFLLVDSVMRNTKSGMLPALEDQESHYLFKFHGNFLANGCAIANRTLHDDFVAKKKRLDDVTKECRKNMADEKAGLWLTRSELDGVPESLLSQLKEGDDEDAGRLWLPTKVPFSSPVMKTAKHENTRKRVYYAIANRMPSNIPLFREMILLRDEIARLLGWPNHLAFRTSQKILKDAENVNKLMTQVRSALTAVGEKDADELLGLKRNEAQANAMSTENLKLFHWDRDYLSKLRIDNFSKCQTSEYFELNRTLRRLLGIYEHLFGVQLERLNVQAAQMVGGRSLVWHDDVLMFTVWNVDGEEREFLAYAYFDLFPRQGKFTHVGHYTLQQRYQTSDGSWRNSSSCVVANYIKPTIDRPTLLSVDDTRKLFHELGHMYHSILSRARYASLHAVNGDFLETPSMMLEQFFWDPEIIRNVSCHYSHIGPPLKQIWLARNSDSPREQPPVRLTREQAAEIADQSRAESIRAQLSELFYASYDILVHSPASHEELELYNFAELYNKLRSEIFHMHGGEAQGEGWEWGQGQAVFRAIQGKYDAGYYCYILGRLFALNILEAGFSNDVMDKDNARRFRDMVLSKGGSQPEMKTLTDFLGHEPSMEPYLKWLQSIASTNQPVV